MPSHWRKVMVTYTITIPATNTKWIDTSAFWEGRGKGMRDDALLLQEIKDLDLDKLEVIVGIKILQIVLKEDNVIMYEQLFPYQNRQKFTWEIDQDLLSSMQNASAGKIFHSDIYNDMWSVGMYPNTKKDDNVQLFLRLCALPPYISKVAIEYEVNVKCRKCFHNNGEAINSFMKNIELEYDETATVWEYATLSFEREFKKFEGPVFIELDIKIVKKFAQDGDEIGENVAKLINYTIDGDMDEKYLAMIEQIQYLTLKIDTLEGYKRAVYLMISLMVAVVIISLGGCWWVVSGNNVVPKVSITSIVKKGIKSKNKKKN